MAVSDIDKHRRRWEENPKGLTFAPYADALRKAGEAEQALDVLKAGLEHHPDYIPANIVLGRCHLDLGDDPSAEGAFQRVLALDPENVIALKALADVNERGQRWDRAKHWLDMLLSIDRGNDVARDQMARVQVAELAQLEQAETRIYPDAPVADEAAVPALLSDGAAAEAGIQLEPVAVGEVPAALADGLPHLDALDTNGRAASETFGLDDAYAPTVQVPDTLAEAGSAGVDFVVEDRYDDQGAITLQAAAGEFAVSDAAETLVPGATEHSADAVTATVWGDVGAGEYVPAIFADDAETVPHTPAPQVTDGLVLDQADTTMIFTEITDSSLSVADAVEIDASEAPVAHAVDDASGFADAVELADMTTSADAASLAHHAESADAVDLVVSAEPVVIESSEDLDTVPAVVFDADDVDHVSTAPALEPEPEIETVHADAAVTTDEVAVASVPVEVPSPVGILALDASELLALEQRARAAVLSAFVARRGFAPLDVLDRAPAADPAVIAALAVAAVPEAAVTVSDAAVVDEPGVTWDEWTWGEHDPDLDLLALPYDTASAVPDAAAAVEAVETPIELAPHEAPAAADAEATEAESAAPVLDEAVIVAPAEVVLDAPAAVASSEPSPFTPASADLATDDEQGAVPPNFAAPVLVTAAMAALYEGQGHLREALATYRELDARTPGVHAERIAALEARLAASAVPAPPVYEARLSGGQPTREFFGALLRTMPPALVRPAGNGAADGSALRKAADPVSLGRLFGEEAAPARPRAVAARTASFDEFYGAAAAPAEANGRDDLESFHAWLQGLKT